MPVLQAHKHAREQVLRTLQLLVEVYGTDKKLKSTDPRQGGKQFFCQEMNRLGFL